MKVLFLTLYPFAQLSDGYIAADLAQELVKKKLELTIITPTLSVNEKKSSVISNGDHTHIYIASGPIQKVNPIKKVIGLSKLDNFSVSYLKKEKSKYDLIITMVSHCAFYSCVKFLKKRDNCLVYNLVKDIFPDNVVDLGLLKKKSLIYKYFRRKEQKYYKISDFLGVLSPANVEYLIFNNSFLEKERIEVNPNSIIPRKLDLLTSEKKQIFNQFNLPENKKISLYGGNLGKPQGLDFLLECVLDNEKRNDSFLLIIGNGTEYTKIVDFFNFNKIQNAVIYTGVSQSVFAKLTSICDIGLVFLNPNFSVPNFPSRILSYMEASLPILFAIDNATDVGLIAEKNRFGLSCLNGDLDHFSKNLDLLLSNDKLRVEYGKNAFSYLNKEFTAEKSASLILSHMVKQ